MKKRLGLLVSVLVVLVLLVAVVPTAAADDHRLFATRLTGAEEVPGPGDPDGSGFSGVILIPRLRMVCVGIVVSNIDTPTAAHIHKAPAGEPGPVVVPLKAPTDGDSITCSTISGDLFRAIWDNPEEYYVNVHNDEFRAGAVRGQLDSGVSF